MTEVGVHRRLDHGSGYISRSSASKAVMSSGVHPARRCRTTDVQGGGGEVIEMSHSLDKKTQNWSLKFQCGRCVCF